jgi:serine phosphatase RsbU (regulator of sigma subunit)
LDPLLIETLLSNRGLTISELVSRIFASIDDFAEGEEQADDITCVAVRRRRHAAGGEA